MITEDGFEGVVNNIVVAHHVALAGAVAGRLSYELRFTYSRNYGAHTLITIDPYDRFETPLPLVRKDQYSLMLGLGFPVSAARHLTGEVVLAYDIGDLLPNDNIGISVSVTRSGVF
jgi:hypothetical protein